MCVDVRTSRLHVDFPLLLRVAFNYTNTFSKPVYERVSLSMLLHRQLSDNDAARIRGEKRVSVHVEFVLLNDSTRGGSREGQGALAPC